MCMVKARLSKEKQLEEAVEENNSKGKMYKGLGIAIGLTLVIILI